MLKQSLSRAKSFLNGRLRLHICIIKANTQALQNKQKQKALEMRTLMTYPVGLVLKAYMAYAFFLIGREKRREQRAEHGMKKPVLQPAQ